MAKAFVGWVAMVLGVVSLIASLRIGTDPHLGGGHRSMVVGALVPAGVVCLAGSHRLLRVHARPEDVEG